ncbi:MAG: hypothetical protein Q8P02_00970, partial [Candidatus Micrarchaeota archaeon]|nr:hypothetical protein [Candidatus Micrarchaeota archaeon]
MKQNVMQIRRAIESKTAVNPRAGSQVKAALERMRDLARQGKLKPTDEPDLSDEQHLFSAPSGAKTATWFASHEEKKDGKKVTYAFAIGSGQTARDETDREPEARAHAILFINHPDWTARFYAKPD